MTTSDRVLLSPNCGSVRCEPGWSWQPGSHPFTDYDLWYVWAGRGEMRMAAGTFALRPGMLFCLRPGQDHAACHDPAHRLGVCYLHFDFVGGKGQKTSVAADLPPLHCRTDDLDWTEQCLRRAVQLRQSPDPLGHAQAARLVEAVLLSMRTEQTTPALSPLQRQQRDAIASVVRRVRENPGERFSVPDLAARAGYSVDHFARLFETHVGKTPGAFCVAARTERAGHLLRESAMSVQQVARDLGYADVYFFSRQFKARTGLSPTQWRKGRGE